VNHVPISLKSLNGDAQRYAVLAALAGALLLPCLGGQGALEWLGYERGALERGQLWRLVTAHLVHLDVWHALLNSAGLALMWVLFARDYRPRQWCLIVLGAMAAIDLGLWFADSTIQWYVGSSGVLHGVMAAGTLAAVRQGKWDGWALAGVLIVKLLYEQRFGALPLSGTHPVVVDAHLFGALGGGAVAVLLNPSPGRI
jgi:rhomboid family GlyGly-CTERM serine protease